MSLFNLDRFRFDKKAAKINTEPDRSSESPESEKENKPAEMKRAITPKTRGVVFDDDEDDKSKIKSKVSQTSKSGNTNHVKSDNTDAVDQETEEKLSKLTETFPHLSRSQLLEVINSTSTLDGAIASCICRFGDKEERGKKRKQDESSSSQESTKSQPSKKRKQSEVSDDDNDDDDDDDDDDSQMPSFKEQEAMVQKLQKRFPDLDKEELRTVLQEHEWRDEDALQALQMFDDQGKDGDITSENEEKKLSDSKSKSASGNNRKLRKHKNDATDSSDDTDKTKDSEDESDSENSRRKTSSLTSWLTKGSGTVSSSSSVKKRTTSNSLKPVKPSSSTSSSSSSTVQMLSRFSSGTSIAKRQAAESKRKARATNKHISSDEDSEDGVLSSEFEDSDDDLDPKSGMSDQKKAVLTFFQESSIDELTLIAGCSIKKAMKIAELRPYKRWEDMVKVFHKGNGLSEDLLLGCKNVLKERKVVLGLMSKCETISANMTKQVNSLMKTGTGAVKQPKVLNNQFTLKPYQLIGLNWLLLLHKHELSGILADEMGLGKTIQAIAFLSQLYQNGIEGPHLIVVPASTLDNWVRELKMWCPSLKVLIYYGSMEDRRYLKHDILTEAVEFNVIVTTYNLAIGNDNDRSLFRKLSLKYAVFDEGHMLKNMNSLRYRHLMAINAERRLLLTGTPLQNNLLELMSLLNFIMPSMFSSSTTQLSKMFSMKSHEEQSSFERERITQAKLIMKPFILRRVKSEVLKQLPAKEEKVEFCSMSEKQKALYQTLLNKVKGSKNNEKRELCNVMMQLRKMANHPLLHRQYYTKEKLKVMSKLMLKEPTHFDAEAALILEDMEVMSDFELHNLCKQYSSISSYKLENSVLLDSGKFHHLTELLASLKNKGDRVVLFSQFTMMLDIVEVLLKHLNHRYVRLDGRTPIADRIGLIDEFNTDPDIFVFLLSTRAGGLGINLTSANVVILHDIDCNPYNDKQAEDRCHRVGQTKTVRVIKLISKDSIEDCILQLGHKKLKLEQDMTAAEEGVEGTIPEDMASLLKASLGL